MASIFFYFIFKCCLSTRMCVLPVVECYLQTKGKRCRCKWQVETARVIVQCNNDSFILSIELAESLCLLNALVLNKVRLSISTFRRLSQVNQCGIDFLCYVYSTEGAAAAAAVLVGRTVLVGVSKHKSLRPTLLRLSSVWCRKARRNMPITWNTCRICLLNR